MIVFHERNVRIGENCKSILLVVATALNRIYLIKTITHLVQRSKSCLQFSSHLLTVEHNLVKAIWFQLVFTNLNPNPPFLFMKSPFSCTKLIKQPGLRC